MREVPQVIEAVNRGRCQRGIEANAQFTLRDIETAWQRDAFSARSCLAQQARRAHNIRCFVLVDWQQAVIALAQRRLAGIGKCALTAVGEEREIETLDVVDRHRPVHALTASRPES